MAHDEICTYEVAKLAKKKGFDEECREFYCDDKSQKRITRISCNRHVTSFDYCSNSMLEVCYPPYEYCYIAAPTQSLLQRWLRDQKGIMVIPYYRSVLRMWSATYELTSPYTFEDLRQCFKTYELALEDALKYALKNLV